MSAAVVALVSLPKETTLVFFADLVLLLVAALICGAAASRVGLSKMVGEIGAGVLLGPTIFGRLCPGRAQTLFGPGPGTEIISGLGQLSVVLLVGVAGMHVDIDKIRQRMARIAIISALGLAIPLAFGVAVGLAVPEPLKPAAVESITFALFLGTAIAVSAIPVIARILMDLGLSTHEIAQVILAAAVVDDVAGWVLLSVVTGKATEDDTHTGALVPMSIATLCVLAALAFFARQVTRRQLMRRCSSLAASTSTTVTAVTIILFATAGQLLGFEPVIGAFFAGMLIALVTPPGSRVHKPMHTMAIAFFSPIFFATIGLQLDLSKLASVPVLILTGTTCLVAVASKFIGAGLGARISRFSWRESIAIGAGLNTRGVIQIVIATVGVRCGVFGPEMFTALVVTTIVTTIIAGPVLRYTLAPNLDTERDQRPAPVDPQLELAISGVAIRTSP